MQKGNFKSALFFYRKHIVIFLFNCVIAFFLTLNIIFGTFEFKIWEMVIYLSSILYGYIFLSKFAKVYNDYNLLNSGNSIRDTKNRVKDKIASSKLYAIFLTLIVSFPIELLLVSTVIMIWALASKIIDINSNGGILFWMFIMILFLFFDYFGIKKIVSTFKDLTVKNNIE